MSAKCPSALFFAPKSAGAERSKYIAITPEVRAYFEAGRVLFRSRDSTFQLQFLGSDPSAEIRAEDPQVTRVNWLIGARPQAWSTNLPTYGKLVCRRIYPGIDVGFGFSEMRLKSEFIIAPGADPRRIGFRYTGLGRPHINERGDLLYGSGKGEFREESPTAFQWSQNRRVEVAARFSLSDDGVIRFELGTFDAKLPLVIDPAVSYSSYVGGHGDSAATAIAADPTGNIYATGWTDSVDFPLAGPIQGRGGGVDAFVLKLNPSGDTLLYATYIGGSGDDRGLGIAVDGAGNAYVTGTTTSPDFPTRLPFQGRLAGTRDAFVLKLNAAGSGLTFSTYLGGSGSDSGNAIAVDTQGNAYVIGDTSSADFPTLAPLQAAIGGRQDAFVVKINSTGTLVYSTYLGGSGDDHGAAIAVDSSGSAYITGGTFSNNFPVVNAFQAANGGGEDVFAAKLTPAGTGLMYSTYLGGSGGSAGAPESGAGVAVDSQGNAFIVGATSSANFPTLGAFQVSYGGGTTDAFIAKLSPPGTALVYSTFVGGSSLDYANAVAVDAAGNAYVAGYTASTDFPVTAPLQATLAGGYDAFILRLNPSGRALNFSTYYGGSGLDSANGIAVDGGGGVYVAGQTLSSDFPIVGGIQASNFGTIEAFVMKLNTQSHAGIFRNGFFWLEDVDGNQQFNSPPDRSFAFGGVAGDIPITGDWNGDGRTKVGIYRPSNGLFVLDYDGDGQFTSADKVYNLGVGTQAGDVPVVGDWNGDGKTKVGLFRQGFFWILDYNGNGVFDQGIDKTYAFGGQAGDLPVVGDWTGTGTSKIGLLRQGFFWILDANGNGTFDGTGPGQDQAFAFGGIAGDVPVVGDWNGSGTTKVGMFRMGFFWVLDANGNHQFDGTGPGQDLAFAFGGLSGDKPVVGKW